MNNQDGQSIKDIAATLGGGQPQPLLMGASSKTRHPGSQNLSSTRPALTRSSAKAGHAVKVVDPSVPKAATLLRTRPQIRATKPRVRNLPQTLLTREPTLVVLTPVESVREYFLILPLQKLCHLALPPPLCLAKVLYVCSFWPPV